MTPNLPHQQPVSRSKSRLPGLQCALRSRPESVGAAEDLLFVLQCRQLSLWHPSAIAADARPLSFAAERLVRSLSSACSARSTHGLWTMFKSAIENRTATAIPPRAGT